jgi:hypothetical protein
MSDQIGTGFLEGKAAFEAVAKVLPQDSSLEIYFVDQDSGNRIGDHSIEFLVQKTPRHGREEFAVYQSAMLADGRVIASQKSNWVEG